MANWGLIPRHLGRTTRGVEHPCVCGGRSEEKFWRQCIGVLSGGILDMIRFEGHVGSMLIVNMRMCSGRRERKRPTDRTRYDSATI